MTHAPASRSVLRLVTGERCGDATSSPGGDIGTNAAAARRWEAAARVELENRAAAALTADDARWALAARTAADIEGGAAAILRPERRRALVAMGGHLGLKPFDTNLVIAIVQDAARSGEEPLGPRARGLLQMVRPAERPAREGAMWPQIAVAVAAGATLLWLLIRWLVG
jgi:hypothetical protein